MRRRGIVSLSLCAVLLAIFILTISLTSCAKSKRTASNDAELLHKTLPGEMFVGNFDVRVVPRMIRYPAMLPVLSLQDDIASDKEILAWFKPKATIKLPDIDRGRTNTRDIISLKYDPPAQHRWKITGEETGTVFVDYGVVGFYGPTLFGLPANSADKMTISDTEAVSITEEYLRTHGGIPKDIASKQLEPTGSGIFPEKVNGKTVPRFGVIEYTIRYNRRFATIPLESDSIVVDVGKTNTHRYVIYKYSRTWHKLSAKSKTKGIIGPEKAIEIAVKHFAPRIRAKSGIVASRLELVYYDPILYSHPERSNYHPGSELRPGWKVRVTGWDAIVNAYTGEIQGDEWDQDLGLTAIKAMQKYENEPLSAKTPVPVRITLIKNGKAVRHWGPDNRQFGAILHEAQNILSKMRPYYKRKADMHGASGDTPFTYPKGGLLLEYGRSNVFLITDSKIGRDIDPNGFPRDGSCRMEFTHDGYYRVYGSEAFICFSESHVDNANRSAYNKQLYGDDPFTKILINVGGPRFMFTDAVASNDNLKDLVGSYANAEQNADRKESK